MTTRRPTRGRSLAAALTGAGLALAGALAGPASPAAAATVSYDLYAEVGSTTLPGSAATLPVWGYTLDGSAPTAPGGPVLEATEGDDLTITLHNGIGERTSLLFQGQQVAPDLEGVPNGGDTTYTVHVDQAGTYLYEAGLLSSVPGGTEHQVAMGLYGALVVHPATAGRAYADAATAFDVDQVMLLGEIDPALNNAADKGAFDMRSFAPKYTLINGRAHPDTAPISASGGDRVLLRYVNAGMVYHSMGVLGAGQTVVALDGSRLDYDRHYTAETIGPGQTADAIITAPSLAGGQQLAVYDASGLLHNNRTGIQGGMFTTIDVTNAPASGDTLGPVLSDVLYDGATLTAVADDTGRGDAAIAGVEFYLDDVTVAGAAMAAHDGAFDAVSEQADASVAIGSGQHALYVRAQDGNGNWGPLSSVLATGADPGGPTTLSPTLAPAITNGDDAIDITATADDTASGNSHIQAAEYFIDTVGTDGLGETMTVNADAPIASLDATIPASVIGTLAEGEHPVFIHAQDSQGNWGDAIAVNLVVDLTAPTTSGVQADPTPNNGTIPFSATVQAVRVSATTMTDASGVTNTTISRAEAFIDTVGANGSGIPLLASDGFFNDQSEGGYADIPLATIKALSNGTHTIYVHARDAAGNWGSTDSTTILVDKTAPTVTASVSPDPTQGAGQVTVSGTANDAATSVVAAEAFVGTDPGQGNGTALTVSGSGPWTFSGQVDVRGLAEGNRVMKVRALDVAGNWSAPVSVSFVVTAPLFYSTLGNSNPPGAGGTADNADIYQWDGSVHSRVWDGVSDGQLLGSANVDGYSRVDATHFYVSLSPNNTFVPGVGTVQDEDVLFYNGDHWEMFFNGTAHGLTGNNRDIDAINVSDVGTLFFSTRGNTNPPGLGGAADDADIYRWNGGNSYSRVFNANVVGLPAAANVDGVVWVDPTHLYLSFTATNTATPGLGNVQDEDVVYRNGSTWSVYFDGTAHGLTSNNLDIDAFDLP
ncbi:MAG: multicopper oxidase domain-containing protein [Nocardioidaceae bacterium]|nr:multicopper oxidase domain-containing protein [Nocardioidaceae bacterium]